MAPSSRESSRHRIGKRHLKRHLGILSLLAGGLASAALAADTPDDQLDTIIVTGTRQEGKKARDSATPIDIVQADDLAATGQTNLLDALKNITPSLNSPAVGYDVGALARTFQLRGLSPSHTLVLVDGKRRHLSASLYADEDPAQGSNAVDLDMIPLNAIDHVEILKDGAAAQYGSDAIAGVVNVILKKSDHGSNVSLLGGGYYDGGGATGQVDADSGFGFGRDGYIHLSASYRHHDFSNRSGDSGGPESAKVQGDPQVDLGTFSYSLETALTDDITAYSFATVGRRNATANENPREPGVTGVAAVDSLYPNGFSPQESVEETDFDVTAGLKGHVFDQWAWDLSTAYGRDDVGLRNNRSVNPDLLNDSGIAQRNFSVGSFTSSELTSNLDIRRAFDIAGLAGPLTVAVGVQDRYEQYKIGAGEPNSYYGGGSAAFPGFRLSDRADADRNSVGAYADLSAQVTPEWQLGLAGRVEHYDGVGDDETGKLSTRYDFTPGLGVRGTVSTGYHAPTLAQEYYSATTVSTGYASIQLPVGSPGSRVLGAPALKPETSLNGSVGLVAEPLKDLHASVDLYQIDVDNRIINSGYVYGDLAAAAIAANGSSIPAGLDPANVAAQFFTNGVDTRTRGIDVSVDYRTDLRDLGLGDLGAIKWVLGAAYNKTEITKIHDAPAALKAAGVSLVDPIQASNLTSATPHTKISLAGTYFLEAWEVTLRETVYGHTLQAQNYGPSQYYDYQTKTAYITDLDVVYTLNDRIRLGVGASNLFNTYPSKVPAAVYQNINYDQYSHVSPYGINGGYYYGRVSFSL